MVARLRKEGFVVRRYKVRLLMKKLGVGGQKQAALCSDNRESAQTADC